MESAAGDEGAGGVAKPGSREGLGGDGGAGSGGGSGVKEEMDREAFLKMARYPVIRACDMVEELRLEALEAVVSGVERYASGGSALPSSSGGGGGAGGGGGGRGGDWEAAARYAKETMDKKFGGPWHCVVGEYFAFEITHELKNLLYVFASGYIAIVLWKG
eukprot:jgi/Chlat1/7438/Chrsp6S00597